MIFKFLRQYFQDDEFEQTKSQLAESQRLLGEYKNFIEKEKHQVVSDKEKVDPDFLTLIWGAVGIAGAIFTESVQVLTDIKNDRSNFEYWIWYAVAVFTLYFMFRNGFIAIQLTNLYSTYKSDKRYKVFSTYLIVGAGLFLAMVVLFYLNNQFNIK